MNSGRESTLVIPTAKDEIVVVGGRHNKTSEKRAWCDRLQDYDFRGCTVVGEDLIDNSADYRVVQPTFEAARDEAEAVEPFDSTNALLFGNDVDCFCVEIMPSLTARFRGGLLDLPMRAGQAIYRLSRNFIYFIGGRVLLDFAGSDECFVLDLETGRSKQLDSLIQARSHAAVVACNGSLFVVGGRGSDGNPTGDVERLDLGKDGRWS